MSIVKTYLDEELQDYSDKTVKRPLPFRDRGEKADNAPRLTH
jgi:hypothetical protein